MKEKQNMPIPGAYAGRNMAVPTLPPPSTAQTAMGPFGESVTGLMTELEGIHQELRLLEQALTITLTAPLPRETTDSGQSSPTAMMEVLNQALNQARGARIFVQELRSRLVL